MPIFYLILLFGFLGGGFWADFAISRLVIEIVGTIFSFQLLIFAYIKNKRIIFPNGSIFLLLFCLIQIPFLILYEHGYSIDFFLLFLSGTCFLISSYNLHKIFRCSFENIVIITSIILGAIYLISHYIYDPFHFMNTPLFYSAPQYLHVHIGDLFAVIFIMSLYRLLKQKKRIYIPVLAISTFFIAVSLSRSALISLAAGLFYLFFLNTDFSKYKKTAMLLFISACVIFLFEGAVKPIFKDREYYLLAIYAFYKRPLGIGLGNFSNLLRFGIQGRTNSIYTHSLPLEVLIGTGIWGLPFFIWLYKVIKDIFVIRKVDYLIYPLMIIVLIINFTFDTTYMIPPMFWILFITLGLAQSHLEYP